MKPPRRPPRWHAVAEWAIRLATVAAVGAVALIFVFLAWHALPILWESTHGDGPQSLRDIFFAKQWPGDTSPTYVWHPGTGRFNVIPLFIGTIKITALSMLISGPLALGCAVFLSEYAPRYLRELIKPAIELLAALPSVVLGFFAIVILASVVQDALGLTYRLNALVASLALSLAMVPIMFTIIDDSLISVPQHIKDAALALGARRDQVVLRVVLPAALPGIAAAFLLGFGRAIGETMVVLMASGNEAAANLLDPSTPARTVAATIASELGDAAQGDTHWRMLFSLGLMLFVVTFVLNLVSVSSVRWLQARLNGAGAREEVVE